MSVETQRRIARNTLTNSLSFAVAFAANLIILPYVVHTLGNEVYGGIWVIVGTLTASLGLLDMGTGTAFVKYIAEYHTRNDDRSLSEVVNTGIVMYAAIGGVLLVLAWTVGRWILTLVDVPAALLDDGVFVLRVGMLIFVLANVLSPLTMMLAGIQRMDLNALISTGGQIASVAGTVFVLQAGWGVRGLILNNLAVLLLTSLVQAATALRLVGQVRFGTRYCRMAMAKRFLGFGMNLQASKLAQVMLFQTDRIVSLKLFGTVAAAYYDVGAKLCSAARSVAFLTISALIPAVAELDAREERDRLLQLYRRGTKYTVIAATTLFAFVAFFAADILRAWMGPEYLSSMAIVSALAAGYFLNICTGVASAVAAGMGRTDFEGKYGVIAAVVNLPVSIGLGLLIGPVGIAIGMSLTLLGGGVYFLRQVHVFLGRPQGVLRESFLKPFAACLLATGAALLLRQMLAGEPGGRWESIGIVLGFFGLSVLLEIIFLQVSRTVGHEDYRMIRQLAGIGDGI